MPNLPSCSSNAQRYYINLATCGYNLGLYFFYTAYGDIPQCLNNLYGRICKPSNLELIGYSACLPWLGCFWVENSVMELPKPPIVNPPTGGPESICCNPNTSDLFIKYTGPTLSVPCISLPEEEIPPPESANCPDNPELCSSGCCCCSSAALSETLSTRCYDFVAASCNADGSGPAPGETFSPSCGPCFETCDLLLNDPDGCSKIKDLSWWNLENSTCICSCKEPVEQSSSMTESWKPTNNGDIVGQFYKYLEKNGKIYALGNFIKPSLQNYHFGAAVNNGTSWEVISNALFPIKTGENENLIVLGSDYAYIQNYIDSEDTSILDKYGFNKKNIVFDILRNRRLISTTDVSVIKNVTYVAYDLLNNIEIARINAKDYVYGYSLNCVSTFNGSIYVGGSFSNIYDSINLNTVTTSCNLFKIVGGSVVDFNPGITGTVTSMFISDSLSGDLIIATTDNIYRMNSAEVITNITPLGVVATVSSMCEFNGELIIGGEISTINGIQYNNIARYSSVNGWGTILNGGTNGPIYSVCVHNDILYVGGTFSNANGVICSNIARFDGVEWGIFTGTNNTVRDMFSQNIGLRIGGDFTKVGEISVSGETLWTSSINALINTQSSCNLTCAICGKCDASVTVENVQCNYRFTLSPSNSCCKPNNSGEKILILWSNFGLIKEDILGPETDAINLFIQNLNYFIAIHDNYEYINIDDETLGLSVYSSAEQTGDPLFCFANSPDGVCSSDDFCTTFSISECGVNLTTYTNNIFNYLCNSEILKQFTRIDLIILVHGKMAAAQGIDYFTQFFNENYQLKKLLDNLNVRIHVVTFSS